MAASQWSQILTSEELQVQNDRTASIDPRYARRSRAFYESRTLSQLKVLAAQAWDCNEPGVYQLARSYAALIQKRT